MFWNIIIIAAIVMAIGWFGYFIYWLLVLRKDEQKPRKSEGLNQANDSMSEYAEKMATFEKKRYGKQS